MDIDQIKRLNEQSLVESQSIAGDISADWEVDTAGNVYRIGSKFQDNVTDLKDEFRESN